MKRLKSSYSFPTNEPQRGRSMVEMLGVLAIIGVLSIGGISGYSMAMNRYRANELIALASNTAVIAVTRDRSSDGTQCASIADTGIDIGNGSETIVGLPGITGITACVNEDEHAIIAQITGSGSLPNGVKKALSSVLGDNFRNGNEILFPIP